MKEKITILWREFVQKATLFFSKKRNIAASVILLIIVLIVVFRGGSKEVVVTDTVKKQTLAQTVLATGQVTSSTDLNLSFTTTGVIKNIRVSVGQKVRKGEVLANLEQGTEFGTLTSARGALLAAQARYQKIVDGASSEEIILAEIALKNAQTDLENIKKQQDGLVQNAYRALLNNDLQATVIASSGSSSVNPTISGTYTDTKEGTYTINGYSTGSGGYFSLSGTIESGTGVISTTNPTPLGTKGLYIQFDSVSVSTPWEVKIPNTKSATYVTYLNAYQSALETKTRTISSAESLVDQRKAELALKKSAARRPDLDLAQADVLSAQGQYQNAQATFEKTILRAPADGVITDVAFKIGEQPKTLERVITLQDVDNLYIEGIVNESRVTTLAIGQPVAVTYDAFGKEQVFSGTVISIDPGATLDDGVANYKINVALSEINPLIRPGMNATFVVTIAKKADVLTIPETALVKKDGGTFVIRVEGKKKQVEIPVTVGMKGDGNLVEIIQGVSEGDTVVINPK